MVYQYPRPVGEDDSGDDDGDDSSDESEDGDDNGDDGDGDDTEDVSDYGDENNDAGGVASQDDASDYIDKVMKGDDAHSMVGFENLYSSGGQRTSHGVLSIILGLSTVLLFNIFY